MRKGREEERSAQLGLEYFVRGGLRGRIMCCEEIRKEEKRGEERWAELLNKRTTSRTTATCMVKDSVK